MPAAHDVFILCKECGDMMLQDPKHKDARTCEQCVRRLRRQAARIEGFLHAVDAALKNKSWYWYVDENGKSHEVNRPLEQRFAVFVDHSASCASHTTDAKQGFTCTCSPEIQVSAR